MRLELRTKGVELTDRLQSFIEKKLRSALHRFGHLVQDVNVRLVDVNGPKGGEDIQCHIQANLGRAGFVTITETRADPFRAVARASHRARYSMSRKLSRLHGKRRGPRGARQTPTSTFDGRPAAISRNPQDAEPFLRFESGPLKIRTSQEPRPSHDKETEMPDNDERLEFARPASSAGPYASLLALGVLLLGVSIGGQPSALHSQFLAALAIIALALSLRIVGGPAVPSKGQ